MEILVTLVPLCFIFNYSLRISHARGLIDDPKNFTLLPDDVQTSPILGLKNKSVFEEPFNFQSVCCGNPSLTNLVCAGTTDFIRPGDSKISSEKKGPHHLQLTESTQVQELGVEKQASDPAKRRMGRDHVISGKKRTRSNVNIYVASSTLEKYSVNVQDKGEMKHIEVSVGKQIVSIVSLNMEYLMNHSPNFGFAASTEKLTQLNDMLHWEWVARTHHNHHKKTSTPRESIVAACSIGFAVLIMCAAMATYYYCVRKREYAITASKFWILLNRPKKFKFDELKDSTNNFDDKQKLGEGGSGAVYKGILHKKNLEVAIKTILTKKGKYGFLAELHVLHRLRHRHLVPFHGWCYNKGILLLAYEYMPNGSLDKHLFCDPDTMLSWSHRYRILLGIASALQYLHTRKKEKVVHGNLKSSSIMLDSELNAYLGDYCVPGKGKARYTYLEGISSTFAYTAPECILTGKAIKASDVYGFGAILLEVACGRRPWITIGRFRCLVNWVWSLYRKGRILEAMDIRLANNFVAEEAERILLLGLACSRPIAKDRPKSNELLEMILGNMPTPDIPQFKQAPTSLSMELQRTKH